MTVRALVIDGITVPVWSCTDLTQTYIPLQAVTRRRFADGSAVQRIAWTGKLRTNISGGGFAPSGLQEIDTSDSFLIWCITPIAINGASNVFTLPATRRTDSGSEPFGFAVVGDQLIETPCAVVTNTATLTTVAGATGYQVRYFPILTVFADPIQQDLARGSAFGWTLEAEEV